MIVTEEEAKTKRCQESFTVFGDGSISSPCLGSDCMAWRWSETPSTWNKDDRDKDRGYCGKAGKP